MNGIFEGLTVRVRESLMVKGSYYITLSSNHSTKERFKFRKIIESNFNEFKKFKGEHYLVKILQV